MGLSLIHIYRVNEIRLAALAHLSPVRVFGKLVGLFDQQAAVAGVVLLHPRQHLFQRHALVGDVGQHRIFPP